MKKDSFIPSAHDHGMPTTAAAGLLAVVGLFNIVGTILSGWLTDRYNPKMLLAVYYQFRGVSLLVLPALLSATVEPSIVIFVVIRTDKTSAPPLRMMRSFSGSCGSSGGSA